MLNIIHTTSEEIPECIVSVDAEKVFDRIEWAYLFSVLENFGFGTMFISWIKLLYSHPTASISTNLQKSHLVLFVSKQTMSLPPALSLFNQFGELSGYKLNLTKCVNVLGVSVTRKYKGLFKENVIILSRWSPLSMSLVGRINSIKMCILPKFLYLFQALPIFIHA